MTKSPHAPPSRVRDFVALTKPGITISNVLMAATGYLAVGVAAPVETVAALLAGTALVVASANAFNMTLEKHTDAQMARTRQRPIAAGRVSQRQGAWLATLLGIVGTACLLLVSPEVATLGAASVVAYAFVYTPLKRRTPFALIVGAVPGAVPPALGVLAADPAATDLALALGALLFLWQIPHFLAIAMRRRDDYAAAGIAALTVVHGPDLTLAVARVTAFALVPVGLLPPLVQALGPVAAAFVALLGLLLTLATFRATWVRPTFAASLVYLPALFVTVACRAVFA